MQTRSTSSFRTEIEFTLPKGYLDSNGVLHRNGVMRLATAADEILPLKDPRVQQNQAYLGVIVLARVITKLGEVSSIDTKVIEGLFTADLNYLQSLYERFNGCDDVDGPLPSIDVAASPRKAFQTVGEV
jgi:hypothetical protein